MISIKKAYSSSAAYTTERYDPSVVANASFRRPVRSDIPPSSALDVVVG